MDMMQFVKSLYPEFPDDRKVVGTSDWGKLFKIDYTARTLFVPHMKALKANLRLIDSLTDAVLGFMHMDLDAGAPDWSKVSHIEDNQDEEQALKILQNLISTATLSPEPVYMSSDIETRTIELRNNRLLMVGFCYDEWNAHIITVFTPAIVQVLQELLTHPNIVWIWQNGKFDTLRLEWFYGIKARVDEDTMLMHYIGINERRGTHGLKELGALFCQAPAWEDELQDIKKKYCSVHKIILAAFTYDMFPRHILMKYLSFDCVVTRRLFFILKPLMREGTEFIYRKLIEASNVYRRVEMNGAYLDQDYLEELEYQLDQDIEKAAEDLNSAVEVVWDPKEYVRDTGAKSFPKFFNMKSPQQLKWLVEKVVGHSIPNTNKETMQELFDDVGDEYPIISAIRDLRRLSKYMDTYVQGLRNIVTEDGRIHCTYNLHGTETGRLSSSEPNMQNIPRNALIKNLFIAAPDKRLVQLDYSQAELRVLAWLSGDDFLTAVYVEDRDLHDAVAEGIYGPNFTKEQRVGAKQVNFGIVYGVGPSRIAQTQKISFGEAKSIIDGWKKNAPDAAKWMQNQRNMAYRGETPSTIFGRERHFILTDTNLNAIENECTNFPVQSIASDLTLLSLLEIQKWIDSSGLEERVKIIITVHDSIVLEVDDDDELVAVVAENGTRIMREVPAKYLTDCRLPFKADVETGYAWGALKEYAS